MIVLSDWKTDPLEAWPHLTAADIHATMGFIPDFVTLHDEPAADQIERNYSQYGGWSPLSGWLMDNDGVIQYPGDSEPLTPAAVLTKSDGEIVRFYPGAWVSIHKTDDSYEVAKID